VAVFAINLNVIPNEAPSGDIVTPIASDSYYSDQLISFAGNVSDVEDSSEDLVVTWNSSLDGDLDLLDAPDSAGLISDATTLSEGEHLVTMTVTDTVGKSATDTVTVNVGPPNTAPTCEITAPATGGSSEQGALIQFEATANDVDVASNLLNVDWSSDKDGVLGSSTPSSGGDVAFLYDALTADSHVVTMTVTDDAGATCSDFITYTVGTPPTISLTAPASLSTFKLGSGVSFVAEVADQEDSPTALTLSWESSIDGVFSTQGAASDGFAQFVETDLSEGTHTVTVTVTDSSNLYSEALVSFEVVPNSAPSISSVSVDPSPAYVEDTLTCTYSGFADVDGDGDFSTYEWTVDGATLGTGPTLTGAFEKDEKVKCTVTPYDGFDEGTALTGSRTIKNSTPEIASVSIAPSGPVVGDTLTCSYASFNDADGDTDVSTFEWLVDGVSSGTASTLSSGFAGGTS
jgi:hypothetical protein